MKNTILALGAVSTLGLMMVSPALAATYEVTVLNKMSGELIAPVLVADTMYDNKIFDGASVTAAAKVQVLTGNPAELAASIGDGATVANGMDGPPGVLLAPGKTITFTVETEAKNLRIFAMVAPTMVPDNYLTAIFDLSTAAFPGMMGDDNTASDGMATDNMASDSMASDGMASNGMGSDGMMASDPMMASETMTMGDGSTEIELSRFDIGSDEGTNTTTPIGGMGFASVSIKRIK
ncbi:MAG: hypothetical protein GXP03_14305 [Alphaproteobacteria bacterium]|nr:hypothetical protein [Alphaproteobacteria bacterium]